MPDEKLTDTKEVVEETKPKGEEQPVELSTTKEPAESPEGEELPDGTKERTKEQFEKLKKSNDELKKELEDQKQLPSVLDYLGSSVPEVKAEVKNNYLQPQAPVEKPQEKDLVDDQGYVNADVLKQQLAQAQEAVKRAEDAEKRSLETQQRILKYEQDSETERLYKEYPELNPLGDTFNKDAYDLVRNELTSQIVQTGTRDAVQAAEKMSRYFREQKKQDDTVIEQRKQVTTATGNQPRQGTTTDLKELKRRSANDPDAVAERMRRLGI